MAGEPPVTTLAHYVLGLAGAALLRQWWDPSAETDQRLDRVVEFARIARNDELMVLPLATQEMDVVEGYTAWSESYDGPNPMIEVEERVCNPILERVAAETDGGVALDAGCGTGRKSATLVALGYDVVGTDLTPAMLDHARANVAGATFLEGAFEALPVDDASVDLVVSSLAVCHVEDLAPVFAEFARVLRPGGLVVVSDPHPTMSLLGGQAFFRDGTSMPFVRNQGHPVADYHTAATEAGLVVTGLTEAPLPQTVVDASPVSPLWPDLVDAALLGVPYLLVVEAALPTS